ncbi:hypothetical protein LMG8323_00794 [Ralstonia mannitolilytica]|nr:hypothetical protein LMG8323_00794 [Ralstonia mannitolilytica]
MTMDHQPAQAAKHTPRVTRLQVIPVAGRDSMLLNLSGAHGPFFTRNIAILEDSDGHIGVGEVPGGEAIRKTIEDARASPTRPRRSSRRSGQLRTPCAMAPKRRTG